MEWKFENVHLDIIFDEKFNGNIYYSNSWCQIWRHWGRQIPPKWGQAHNISTKYSGKLKIVT